jgi:regulator of nonsense transcripts 1
MFINTNNKTTLKYNLIDEKLINKKHKELYKNKNIFTSERDSGKSYENELEAEITIKILNMLNSIKSYQKGKYDIGIITPYIGQKKLILEKLYLNNLDTGFDFYSNNIINIASVDSFQGKEKDFIIINTVRSNYKKIIGFLKDPRRLNVSLTRARHGLIIIGDAYCLANAIGEKENKYNIWRYLIKYYQDIGVIVDYNEGNQEKMFSLTQILNKDEKLEKYKFIEYDYDGKCNRHNINKDYIDDYGYIKKKDFFHYIDDNDFCINNSLFYDNDFNFDEYYNDLYNEEFNNYGYYNNNIIEYNENSYYYNSNYYNGNYYNSNYNNNHYNRGYY